MLLKSCCFFNSNNYYLLYMFVLLKLFRCRFFERFNYYLQHLTTYIIHTHYIFSMWLQTTESVFKRTGQMQRRLKQRFCKWSAFGTFSASYGDYKKYSGIFRIPLRRTKSISDYLRRSYQTVHSVFFIAYSAKKNTQKYVW